MMTHVTADPPACFSLTTEHRGQAYELQYLDRPGTGPTIVFLHGLGCGKEDCLPWIQRDPMIAFRVLAFDFPGCGGSRYTGHTPLQMDDLVALTQQFVAAVGLREVVIVGHSMGGLIGLLLCECRPDAIRAFINIEGNLTPEDCTFSRRAVSHDFADFQADLFAQIKQDLASASGVGFARYRAALESGVSARAFYDYALETVAHSNNKNLLDRFLALRIPMLFIHGSENDHLTYLPRLCNSACDVVRIANANHFSFHDNPDAFAAAVAAFLGALPRSTSSNTKER